jgi:16S rRNA (guanine527-N7)-methyltransferase
MHADAAFLREVEGHLRPHLPPDLAAAQARFCAALADASRRLNLTTVLDPAGMARRHVLDSLLVLPWLGPGGRLADLGSGGGVPGIPLALALPGRAVVLLESRRRKAQALEALVGSLGLGGRVLVAAERGEAWLAREAAEDVVVRAVGPVARVLELLAPVRGSIGRLLLLKGPAADAELAQARPRLPRLGWPEPERGEAELPEGEGRRVILVFRGALGAAPGAAR